MPFTFANPLGLLALLALPVVLAIHFLQRRTRTIPVSTLFLIEQHRDQARMGRRFDRLITSVPLWLQLLMVLLLTALLAQPRLPAADSVLRIGVVIDDSASMRVFKSALSRHLADFANQHRGQARRIDWLVLPADSSQPRLYAGDSVSAMLQALEPWQPVGGPLDPGPSLRLARERVGPHGMVVYATDTPRDSLPVDTVLLAVGDPLANVGCTGITVTEDGDEKKWQAMIINHGLNPDSRSWHLEWDGANRSEPAVVQIPAGGAVRVGGQLPAGATRLCLVLEPDEFTLDDRFPFLAPAPKPLYFRHQRPQPFHWLPERIGRSVPVMSVAPPGTLPDLVLAASSDGRFPTVTGPAILMSAAGNASAKTLAEPVAAARHPWVAGLFWETLTVQEVPLVPAEPDDQVLVWAGPKPLLSLRPAPPSEGTPAGSPPSNQLVIHFNPNLSNWDRLPAAAVLLLRYCEEVRLAKRGTSRDQLEPRQALASMLPGELRGELVLETLDASGKATRTQTLPGKSRAAWATPAEPGFLRVRDGDGTLIEGAVAFADAREGDFRACATRLPTNQAAAASQASDALAPWWPLVMLLLLILLLLSWAYAAREARAAQSIRSAPA